MRVSMFNKSLDFFNLLLIVLAMVIGYTMVKNVTDPVVCFFTSCKAELEQTVETQKQKIQDLEKTIENMKKSHQVELDNVKNNKEVIQEVYDKDTVTDERKSSALDKINMTAKVSKVNKKQVSKTTNQTSVEKTEPIAKNTSSSSLTDVQKAEIQIDAIWEMYCSSNYVTCKG